MSTEPVRVVVTDFGNVSIGPKFAALYDELEVGLANGRHTKAYRRAVKLRDKLDDSVCALAFAHWEAGDILEKTP